MGKTYWILWGLITAFATFTMLPFGLLVGIPSLIIYPTYKRNKAIKAENATLKDQIKHYEQGHD